MEDANGAGFVPASQESEWCAALKTRDCKKLLRFLHQQPDLWRQIDSINGRTVLHVAVIQACSELVVKVLKSVNEPPNPESNLSMLVKARDKSLCNADAHHLARIVGNKDIINMINEERAPDQQAPGPQAPGPQAPGRTSSNRLGNDVCRIIQKTIRKHGNLTTLRQKCEVDVDYNFVRESRQLTCFLHVACKMANQWDFIYEVISRTKARSNDHVQFLFKLKDPQGRTFLHVAVEEDGFHDDADTKMAARVRRGLEEFLEPGLDDECVKTCINAQDSAGRTPLHRAVANKHAGPEIIKVLVDRRMTDVNALWKSLDERVTGNVTALHLAVLHNNLDAAKVLLERKETRGDIGCNLYIEGSGISKRDSTTPKLSGSNNWTALELATMMGQVHMLGTLLETKIIQKTLTTRRRWDLGRCIHLAAARGDPQCLQLLMQHALRFGKGDYLRKIFDGFAPLHFAVHASHPKSEQGDKINHFLTFFNYVNVYGLEQVGVENSEIQNMDNENDLTSRRYGGKKACANLLLQAGANIWQRDEDQHIIADPGMDAPDEDRHWWYEKLAKKTSDTKKKINAGGTATAVVAALIASASFSSHLSPPISYDQLSPPIASDHVMITKGWVRTFVITNNLSFYLAITSIMFAIMPSIPLSHEDLTLEIIHSRKNLSRALFCLLVSILCFILSFTSSAIAIMPNENISKYLDPTYVPTGIGGLCCIIGILFFSLRLWSLYTSTKE